MIDKVLGDNIDYAKMLVNKTPAALASAADLNYGTANSFVDQLNPYAEVRTKDYDTVQSGLTTSDPIFQDARFAKAELEAQKGKNAQIVRRLSDRRSENPASPGQAREGDIHKPHQVCALHWSILTEFLHDIHFNADGCGTGKSHEFTSYIVGDTRF
jgi:hypothetical protein